MYAVVPKTDCPHLGGVLASLNLCASDFESLACQSCKNEGENWICLSCKKIFCSRFVNGHMLEHANQSKHLIAVSFTDNSAWCYSCDSYISHTTLDPVLVRIEAAPRPQVPASTPNSNNNSNNQNVSPTASVPAAAVAPVQAASVKPEAGGQTPAPSTENITASKATNQPEAVSAKPDTSVPPVTTPPKPSVPESNATAPAPAPAPSSEVEALAKAESSANVAPSAEAAPPPGKVDSDQRITTAPSGPPKVEPSVLDRISQKVDQLASKLEGLVVAPKKGPHLKTLDLEGVAEYIQREGGCKNIIVMTGAGISVAAGIPDFRTPGTGLYDNLQKYNLPHPTAVFEIDFFRRNPKPFFLLAKELYPGNFNPTRTHYFIKLLNEKGLLLRNFTQNIDTLERVAGIPADKLVEAHGSFGSSHCVSCKHEHSVEYVKTAVFSDQIPYCSQCKTGLVKPDIVFFGEGLPKRFFDMLSQDFEKCDLLLVLGTSLQVHPFASLIKRVPVECPRVLLNMEVAGEERGAEFASQEYAHSGFLFNSKINTRDVKWLGACDDGVNELARLLGWEQELAIMCKGDKRVASKKGE